MAKQIETDFRTFIKFWSVPLVIAGVLFFLYKAVTGLIIVGISIFLALALKPLVRKVNGFFTKHFGTEKKHQTASAVLAYLIVVLVIRNLSRIFQRRLRIPLGDGKGSTILARISGLAICIRR